MAKTTVKHMNELRSKPVDELLMNGENLRAELFALKFQAAVGSLEKTHRINELRKEVARIELVLGEKRRNGEDTSKKVKGDYNKAVIAAEESGKEIRKKQREQIEKMQAEQFGQIDEDVVAQAMANAENADANVEEVTENVEKEEGADK